MRPISLLLALLLPGCPEVKGYSSGEICKDPTYDPQTAPRTYTVTADTIAAAAGEDGVLDLHECAELCAAEELEAEWNDVTGCNVEYADTGVADSGGGGGTLTCEGTWQLQCIGGRAPAGGLRVRARARGTAAGRWLGRVAAMEAAAIGAFRDLAADLERLGAPAELVTEARAAAEDEVRHARQMRALARAHGGQPAHLIRRASRPLDLTAFAAVNAASGCVEETWSALLARHQALRAPEALRPVLTQIAADEARHAELSWRVHAWALAAGADADIVAQAMRQAAQAVHREARRRAPAGLGLPSPRRARRLAAELDAALWV